MLLQTAEIVYPSERAISAQLMQRKYLYRCAAVGMG